MPLCSNPSPPRPCRRAHWPARDRRERRPGGASRWLKKLDVARLPLRRRRRRGAPASRPKRITFWTYLSTECGDIQDNNDVSRADRPADFQVQIVPCVKLASSSHTSWPLVV